MNEHDHWVHFQKTEKNPEHWIFEDGPLLLSVTKTEKGYDIRISENDDMIMKDSVSDLEGAFRMCQLSSMSMLLKRG